MFWVQTESVERYSLEILSNTSGRIKKGESIRFLNYVYNSPKKEYAIHAFLILSI